MLFQLKKHSIFLLASNLLTFIFSPLRQLYRSFAALAQFFRLRTKLKMMAHVGFLVNI